MNDKILLKSLQAELKTNGKVVEREHQIFDQIKLPGLDRKLMPERPEKSEQLRKLERCQYYPFIKTDIPEFERQFIIEKFESVFKEHEPRKPFDFGDR